MKFREEQLKQIACLIEEAVRTSAVNLDEPAFKRLIQKSDSFKKDIMFLIEEHSMSTEYCKEEVYSKNSYSPEYQVLSLTEQVCILQQAFPGLGEIDKRVIQQPLPTFAEGWFAFPRQELIGKDYIEVLQKVFNILQSELFNFSSYEGIYFQDIKRLEKTSLALKRIGKQQKGDILIIPCQFGMRHRGRSVRRAYAVFPPCEFGLGTYEISIMLLTHKNRLWFDRYGLFIDCVGDKIGFKVPIFWKDEIMTRFGTRGVRESRSSFGAATGFLV